MIVVPHRLSPRFTARQAQVGGYLFAAGLTVLALAAWDNSTGLPFAMPGFWNNQRTLCLFVAICVAAFGGFVLLSGPRAVIEDRRFATWRPTTPGKRFHSLTVYTREGCHLCDEAIELLQSYCNYLPVIQEIDIDADPALQSRFNLEVPVVEIDGKIRFKGRISELLLRRLIEGTSPR